VNQKQRRHLEQRLLRERERARQALRRMAENTETSGQEYAGTLTNYPLHLADEASATMEQEKDFLLLSQEGRLVYWIDEALRTLYRRPRAYGRCSSCGQEIALERLELVPWASLCLECQREEEKRRASVSEAA
jgi:DnaK suppressor protein